MHYATGKANRLGNRESNQDRFAIIERPEAVLLVLADGMGGYRGGSLAANALVLHFTEAFNAAEIPMFDPAIFLRETCIAAHNQIIAIGAKQHPPMTPRTTAVVCVIQNATTWWTHVGDSRVYHLRSGEVISRTRDHSVVEELIQKGKLTESQAQSHPQRNKVTRCLGSSQRLPNIPLSDPTPLEKDDVLLLCSDGFWSALNEHDIARSLTANTELNDTLNALAGEAEAHSYPNSDNVSAVALRWMSAADDHFSANVTGTTQRPEVDFVIDEIDAALKKLEESKS